MTMDRLAHLAKTRTGQVPDVVRDPALQRSTGLYSRGGCAMTGRWIPEARHTSVNQVPASGLVLAR